MKPTPSALKWLAEKRARVANEYEQTLVIALELTQRADQLKQDLEALDRTLGIYDARIQGSSIEPVNGWRGNYGKRGALREFVLETLKARTPESLSTDNIAALVIAHFGLGFATPEVRSHWYSGSFRSTLKKLAEDGLVIRDTPQGHVPGEPVRWRFKGAENQTLEALAQSATKAAGVREPAPS